MNLSMSLIHLESLIKLTSLCLMIEENLNTFFQQVLHEMNERVLFAILKRLDYWLSIIDEKKCFYGKKGEIITGIE